MFATARCGCGPQVLYNYNNDHVYLKHTHDTLTEPWLAELSELLGPVEAPVHTLALTHPPLTLTLTLTLTLSLPSPMQLYKCSCTCTVDYSTVAVAVTEKLLQNKHE